QPRAGWPNPDPANPLYSGWAVIDKATATGTTGPNTYRFRAEQPARKWSHPEQAELNIVPWYCWVNDLIPVKSANGVEKSITLTRAPLFDFMSIMPGNRFRVENMLEEPDQAGESCLRTDTGRCRHAPSRHAVPRAVRGCRGIRKPCASK